MHLRVWCILLNHFSMYTLLWLMILFVTPFLLLNDPVFVTMQQILYCKNTDIMVRSFTPFSYWMDPFTLVHVKFRICSALHRILLKRFAIVFSFLSVQLNGPVYSLLWNPRKEQLICGREGYVGVLQTTGKSLVIMWKCSKQRVNP